MWWRRRESNPTSVLKTLNLLILIMPALQRMPQFPNLLYVHCTKIAWNSQNSNLRTSRSVQEHSEACLQYFRPRSIQAMRKSSTVPHRLQLWILPICPNKRIAWAPPNLARCTEYSLGAEELSIK